MEAFVVDASAIIPNLVNEADTTASQAMFRRFTGQHSFELVVPEFARLECLNVLWKRVRFYGLPAADAKDLISDLLSLPFTIHEVEGLHGDAFDIAVRHQLAVYDSVYIALAKELGFPLVTVDQRQSNAASAEGVALIPLTDF